MLAFCPVRVDSTVDLVFSLNMLWKRHQGNLYLECCGGCCREANKSTSYLPVDKRATRPVTPCNHAHGPWCVKYNIAHKSKVDAGQASLRHFSATKSGGLDQYVAGWLVEHREAVQKILREIDASEDTRTATPTTKEYPHV